jgi:mono/diheme cytochrome c family protein
MLTAFAARLGQAGAMTEAIAAMKKGGLNEADQQTYLDLFAATVPAEALPIIAGLVRAEKNETKRAARLSALGGFRDAAAAEVVLEVFPTLSPRLQSTAQRMLCERPAWALAMLQRANAGTFKPGALSTANAALLRASADSRVVAQFATFERRASGDPAEQAAQRAFETGKAAYNLTCAACHQEAGDGRLGLAPALVGSRWLQLGDDILARIVLHGKETPARGFVMPPWKSFDDAQLAAILTYVRREFGNQATVVTPATIAATRAATATRDRPWKDAELDPTLPPPRNPRN